MGLVLMVQARVLRRAARPTATLLDTLFILVLPAHHATTTEFLAAEHNAALEFALLRAFRVVALREATWHPTLTTLPILSLRSANARLLRHINVLTCWLYLVVIDRHPDGHFLITSARTCWLHLPKLILILTKLIT